MAIFAAVLPLVALGSTDHLFDELAIGLVVLAVASSISSAQWAGAIDISANFVCYMLAIAFLGPVPAFAVAVITELTAWLVERYRRNVLPINLAASAVPTLLAGIVFNEVTGTLDEGNMGDIALLAGACIGLLALNYVLLHVLMTVLDGGDLGAAMRFPKEILPSILLTLAMSLAIAEIYARYGLAAGIFVIISLFALSLIHI